MYDDRLKCVFIGRVAFTYSDKMFVQLFVHDKLEVATCTLKAFYCDSILK